ncbi:hypothetical protein ILYODFUR_033725 [Ilyodon furcidens]|uniref:Uncharacterized protein n=1 Tax=Ilyodon furcidens TaxID=33524 RepID=A0ABV0T2F2_9TELE
MESMQVPYTFSFHKHNNKAVGVIWGMTRNVNNSKKFRKLLEKPWRGPKLNTPGRNLCLLIHSIYCKPTNSHTSQVNTSKLFHSYKDSVSIITFGHIPLIFFCANTFRIMGEFGSKAGTNKGICRGLHHTEKQREHRQHCSLGNVGRKKKCD